MRLLPLLLLTTELVSASPVRVMLESAQVTLGPGIEPPPGVVALPPRLEARFKVIAPPRGASLEFRCWRASGKALRSLQKGKAIQLGAAGMVRVEGTIKKSGSGQDYALISLEKTPWNSPETLVVEVWFKGRLADQARLPILERNLQAIAPPGESQR